MIFLDLFLTFTKIGTFNFGGGYAMLPLLEATEMRMSSVLSLSI